MTDTFRRHYSILLNTSDDDWNLVRQHRSNVLKEASESPLISNIQAISDWSGFRNLICMNVSWLAENRITKSAILFNTTYQVIHRINSRSSTSPYQILDLFQIFSPRLAMSVNLWEASNVVTHSDETKMQLYFFHPTCPRGNAQTLLERGLWPPDLKSLRSTGETITWELQPGLYIRKELSS